MLRYSMCVEMTKGVEMQGTMNWETMNRVQRVERHVWGRVRSGFIMFVPILVTYLVLRFLVSYTDGLLAPLLNLLPFNAPGLSLLLLFIIFYFSGLVLSPRVGKATIAAQHALFSRIPVIKSIYGLTEQVAGHLSSYEGHEFSRVVLVEWPKPNVFALGFVTGHCNMQGDDSERVAVYIPTVPNPTSGMFALMRQCDVIDTDITVEEAIKLVLSGGIVLPDKMNDIKVRGQLQEEADEVGEWGEQIPLITRIHDNRISNHINRSSRNGSDGHGLKMVSGTGVEQLYD